MAVLSDCKTELEKLNNIRKNSHIFLSLFPEYFIDCIEPKYHTSSDITRHFISTKICFKDIRTNVLIHDFYDCKKDIEYIKGKLIILHTYYISLLQIDNMSVKKRNKF